MSDVEVSSELLRPLEQLAAERGESVSAIVEQLIADYLRERRHRDLLKEMDEFRRQHAGIRERYANGFVAMRGGQVLDHDLDGAALYRRLRARYGDLPILIVEVTDQPEQLFTRLNRQVAL